MSVIRKIIEDFVSGKWVCPECKNMPPFKKLCGTCMFMTNEQGKKISMKTIVELTQGGNSS